MHFINIHTHHLHEGEIAIKNIFPSDEIPADGWFSAGLHPWYLHSEENVLSQLQHLEEFLNHPRCLAIGEAGLDKMCHTPFKLQQLAFEKQVKLSLQFKKPLIIHNVKAWDELFETRKNLVSAPVWIFHGFNSSVQMANQILDVGGILSFGKVLLSENKKLHDAFQSVPTERLFLETDDSERITIEQIYHRAAALKKITVEELQGQMEENFKRLFF